MFIGIGKVILGKFFSFNFVYLVCGHCAVHDFLSNFLDLQTHTSLIVL
jgi:hypothetical protein